MNDVLAELEEKVRAAAEELRRLREDNRELRAELERRAELAAAEPDPAAADWQIDRAAIQTRVERLVNHLEALLG